MDIIVVAMPATTACTSEDTEGSGVGTVTVEGRDLANARGGSTIEIQLPS
ncbi:MAG: hypothetical protein R3A49_04950 [Acidimicrobiia bacterium]